MMRRALAAAILALALVAPAADAAPGDICDRTISPPTSVEGAANQLLPSERLCLRGGLYVEEVDIRRGGNSTGRTIIRSYPGEVATVCGRLRVTDEANWVRVAFLRLRGDCSSSDLPSPTINGDDIVFANNDVSYGPGSGPDAEICFVNNGGWGVSYRTLIVRNRIHHCGDLPATNHDHGIYCGDGTDWQVYDNVIDHNADRGFQSHGCQNARLFYNVIDSNGQGVNYTTSASGNRYARNVISNSKLRWNAETWSLTGTGNVFAQNCVWASNPDSRYNSNGGVDLNDPGVEVRAFQIARPVFVNPDAGDYRQTDASGCLGYGPRTANIGPDSS
jgi:hypothetical protein